MSGTIPQTPEDFQFWMVERVGEIQTSQATILGRIDTAIANHEALVDRVSNLEGNAKDARKWENIKFTAAGLVQGAVVWFKHSGAAHVAAHAATLLGF